MRRLRMVVCLVACLAAVIASSLPARAETVILYVASSGAQAGDFLPVAADFDELTPNQRYGVDVMYRPSGTSTWLLDEGPTPFQISGTWTYFNGSGFWVWNKEVGFYDVRIHLWELDQYDHRVGTAPVAVSQIQGVEIY